MGFISQSALRIRDSYAEWDAERRFSMPGMRVTDPKAAQCGEVLKGVLKPAQCKLFGKECTPEHPVGALMVSSEGSCAAYYNYEHRKSEALTQTSRRRGAELQMSAAAPKIRFRDAQIEMAHGAGGKASRRLVEGLFAPLLFGGSTEPLGDAAHVSINGTRIAITTDSFVVKPLRFPGGSIGELAVNGTVNDLAVSGAKAEALVVTYVLEAGLPTEILEAEVRAMAEAARRGGCRDRRAATRRSSSTARPTACTSPPRASAVRIPGVTISAAVGSARATKCCSAGPIGDHGITILLARGELDLEGGLVLRYALRACRWWRRLPQAAGARHSLDARSHARRRRHVSERTGARLRSRRAAVMKIGYRCATRCAAPANCWGSIRCISPMKASSWRSSRRSTPRRRSTLLRARRAATKRRSSARFASSRPAPCSGRPATEARA